MKIRAQMGKVLNLDKCIGCHTCSVTCKNVWTSRKGVEYAWFNNVETKPGQGYPVEWEDQDKYKGGWELAKSKSLQLRIGNRLSILSKIFANPVMPTIENYYEPFTFDFSTLKSEARLSTPPSARPYSLISGKRMEKIEYGPNWEDNLGGPFKRRKNDPNLKNIESDGYEKFEKSFMYYIPRLCEHCLNPACKASCPSGAIYKRKEDGIVLINQDKCRGWRECISACPYKKIYFNWERQKSEKCTFCFPLIESGKPTVCSESCVGRIRYIGVLLYDEEKIAEYAATPDEQNLYEAQMNVFLDPNDPEIYQEALAQGITEEFLQAAKKSPVYKMIKEWKIAFPLHPEYRTLPMVWYIPPLSSFNECPNGNDNIFPNVDEMRIPIDYIAKMLTAGDEGVIYKSLTKMLYMRKRMRDKTVEGIEDPEIPKGLDLNGQQFDEMYRYLALASYQDRFVIPTSPNKDAKNLFELRTGLGFEYPGKEKEKQNLFGGQ